MAKDHHDRSKNQGALFKNRKETAGETYMSLALRPKDAHDKGGDNTTTSDAPF
jgi:hypothetical protein